MRIKSAAGLLVALALALASCGSDDNEKPSADRSAATGATGATQAPVTKRPSKAGSDTTADTGGSTQPKSESGKASTPSDDSSAGSGNQDAAKRDKPRKKPASRKKSAPPKTIEDFSPAQRKALHKDLYTQGKNLCGAYTPAQLAEQYNIQATRPADVAREYAELYEQGNPSLVLPYQQGCLAGFEQRAKKNRNSGDGTGG